MSADTQIAPYFDDYSEDKNFQKILFKPQFPVQARELNQIQTLLQKQLERLGNRVLKQGTVVSGCETVTTPNLAYAKLKNNETNGDVVDVSRYVDKFIKNSSNTVGKVVAGIPGYVDQDPDLNTLYVRYLTSGDDGTSYTYSADEVLTVYDPDAPIENLTIVDGSAGFSNGDTVHFLSSVKVTNASGGNTFPSGLFVGDIISDGSGANVAITSIDTTGEETVLGLAPQIADQAAGNLQAWTINADTTFINANTAQTLTVAEVIGTGAVGTVEANAIGEITGVTLNSSGSGYEVLPNVFVTSATASTTQLQSVAISPENFTAKVAVAGPLYDPIGVGFGLAIDKGQVYQQGYITRTDPQFVVVEKYNSTPSEKAVGFETYQEIVTAQEDESLLDNALGSPNHTAPGADRLKVSARAIVLSEDEAAEREDFLPLIEFSEGEPFQVAEQTESNLIDEHLAVRTFEENGNFVVDPFLLTTKSSDIIDSDEKFKIVVDPGVAYINGYRVATQRNFARELDKAIDTKTVTETVSSTGYGNYVVSTALRGPFNVGELVQLANANNITIGQAFLKGYKVTGTGNSRRYQIYLFDVKMNAGQVFKNVRLIRDNSIQIANIELVQGNAVLYSPNASRMVFNAPVQAVKSIDSVSYVYQKSGWGTVSANTSGQFALVTSDSVENFPISGVLDVEDRNQVLVSTKADVVSSATLTGTIDATAANNTVSGTGTAFLAELEAGQFVEVANTTASEIVQVASIANNTSLQTVTAPTITLSAGDISRAFKVNEAITPASVTVSGDRQTMTVDLGVAIPTTEVNISANVERSPTVAAKTVQRKAVARLNLNTNAQGVDGPWALGHSDIIRLRGVYKGSNTTFTAAQGTDVTDSFYIDANHTPDTRGTGYLYKRNTSSLTVTTADRLLVVFDLVTKSGAEVVTVNSYPLDDDLSLTDSTTTLNTVELPEVFGEQYVDLRDAFDFRPGFANTVAIHTTESSAPINPTEPAYGSSRLTTTVRVPAPDTEITSTIEYYLPRRDRVIATFSGDVKVLSGQAGSGRLPEEPEKSITINVLDIPPYPSLPANLNEEMQELVNLRTANENLVGRRNVRFAVNTTLTDAEISDEQPRRYTQRDIGSLDRRLNAVEYYLSLTAAEAQAAARHIGTSTANVNRFKFGFLVDSFVDNSRSQTEHPHYAASLEEGFVTSKYDRIAINVGNPDHTSNGLMSLPYESSVLVNQLLATDGPIEDVVPTTPDPEDPGVVSPVYDPIDPVVEEVITQRQQVTKITARNRLVSMSGRVKETSEFHMSSLPGRVELYFNFRDNDNGIDIYQGDTPNFSIAGKTPFKDARAALRISGSDSSKMTGMGKLEALDSVQYIGGHPTREDAGKILWNHNPDNGRYYKVVVTKYRKSGSANNWKGLFFYRIFYPVDTVERRVVPPFNGVVEFNGSATFDPPTLTNDYEQTGVYSVPILQPQVIRVVATGLKPLTVYGCIVEGVDYNDFIAPVGKELGDVVASDAEGRVEFDLYYNRTRSGAASGNKEVIIYNEDGSARATGILGGPPAIVSSPYVSSGGGGRLTIGTTLNVY